MYVVYRRSMTSTSANIVTVYRPPMLQFTAPLVSLACRGCIQLMSGKNPSAQQSDVYEKTIRDCYQSGRRCHENNSGTYVFCYQSGRRCHENNSGTYVSTCTGTSLIQIYPVHFKSKIGTHYEKQVTTHSWSPVVG